MKTIVIAGASSGVGKTSLARELVALLPGARRIKIGRHQPKPGVDGAFYPLGTPYAAILHDHGDAPCLLIESNRILEQMSADVVIYLDGPRPKPSAAVARARAALVSGRPADRQCIASLAARLEIPAAMATRLAWLAGARPEPVGAVVLAGGQSSRMGTDKAFLHVAGEPQAARLCRALALHVDEVMLSVPRGGKPGLPPVRTIPDRASGKGPLMALYSCLLETPYRVNFFVACDIPHIEVPLLRLLLSHCQEYDAVVPSFQDGRCEPLYAVYSKDALVHLPDLLAGERLSLRGLLARCRTRVVPCTDSGWYANLNTRPEYEDYVRKSDGDAS
jgi:molybdopterin-guanine dinucleotide biosynthesis protein A